MDKSKPIVISLGGSLAIPKEGFDTAFLSAFNTFIRTQIQKGFRFFVVVGGGATARNYIDAAKMVVGDKISDWDLDWLGIHATHLNGHLIRTIFQDIADPRVMLNYDHKLEKLEKSLVIAAGWQPGCSTDYDAVYLAKDYGAQAVINMSNIKNVYDKDPKKFTDAHPYEKMSWGQLEQLVGDKWIPGANLPFDPIATKLAKKIGLTVYVVGKDLENVEKILAGEKFEGAVIS
jgi:uridylate kinase